MKLFHQAPFAASIASKSVVTIGNFDGMHLGHQAILTALKAVSLQRKLASTVVIFEPQPAEFLGQKTPPARLMRVRDKLEFLRVAGIDQVLCLRFDEALAQLSAEQFVNHVLIEQLQAKHVLVGDDFRFGHQRSGDFAYLAQSADQFSLEALSSFQIGATRVSSSLIRASLASGDFVGACALLGRPFSMTETVIHGMQRGRTLNFPTINMALGRRRLPIQGVFAVRVFGVPGQSIAYGVANIGCRPTIGGAHFLLETHLFDVNQDLYGQRLRVEFAHKLRDEAKFASLTALQAQIGVDVKQARQFFDRLK